MMDLVELKSINNFYQALQQLFFFVFINFNGTLNWGCDDKFSRFQLAGSMARRRHTNLSQNEKADGKMTPLTPP